jgi:hypothetical protein
LGLPSQLLVFEVRRLNRLQHSVAEKVGVFAAIETETHFVAIGLEMLSRDSRLEIVACF